MESKYLVPECNVAVLEEAIAKLNKRARKIGVPEIVVAKRADHVRHQVRQLQVDGRTKLCWRDSIEKTPVEELAKTAYLANAFEPTGEVMQWWELTVTGETPKLDGWEFVAVLSPLEVDGAQENFVRTLPGQSCPKEFRTRIGECDHCKAIRRRKETFVVKNGPDFKCVGRQCVKDFLGYHADPHKLAGWAELLADLAGLCSEAGDMDEDGFDCGGGRRDRTWALDHFLSISACRVRKFGWKSRGAARERYEHDATADVVLAILTPPWSGAGQEERDRYAQLVAEHTVEERDITTAEEAIDWAGQMDPGDNDYLANVNLVARCGMVNRKTAGVAASILVAHAKHCEREIERQRKTARPESNWIGEEGKRIELLKVQCEKVIANEGAYGVTGIHKMNDEAGNDLTWFASSAEWLKAGEWYFVAGSVKKHGDFRGRKQTVLTRVRVLTEEEVEKIKAKQERAAKKAAKKLEVTA